MTKDAHHSESTFPKVIGRLVRGFGAGLVLGFLAALAGIVVFGHFASDVAAGETTGFDRAVRDGIHYFATPFATRLMIGISFLGSTVFLTGLGAAVLTLFLYLKWKREAVVFLIAMAGQIALHLGLKEFYQRARPEPFFEYAVTASSYSFPSGHALASFCFYGILAWFAIHHARHAAVKWIVGAATAVLIFAVGLSRVYLGMHYPSDVIAGYLAAGVWTLTVVVADASLHRDRGVSRQGGAGVGE